MDPADLELMLRPVTLESIMGRTKRSGECLLWTGGVDAWGYGRVVYKGKRTSTHRVIAEMAYGELGIETVHHKCANRLCVRPEHLQPVTSRENTAEMQLRNFYLSRIGELESALRDVAPNHEALNRHFLVTEHSES